jgi:hypothetical protein
MVKAPPPDANAPKLTAENFEKELKDLAAKAQEETTFKFVREQAVVLFKAGLLLSLAGSYSTLSQLNLSPIYGGIPSGIWHSKLVFTACFLGWSGNLFLRRRIPIRLQYLLPLLAAWIPVTQFFLFKFSGSLGANYGPLITEAVTFAPLLILSVACAATVLEGVDLSIFGKRIAEAAPGLGSFAFFKTAEYFSGVSAAKWLGSSIVASRVGLQILLSGIYAASAPSKYVLYALPALLHTAILNVHFQGPLTNAQLSSTLAKDGYTILARQDSNTGYISVLESAKDHFRVMRCDHSLLGGNWMVGAPGVPVKKQIAEPIYGVFAMLEAVRLVEVPVTIPDKEANALVM